MLINALKNPLFCTLVFVIAGMGLTRAQLSVDNTLTASELAQSLAGPGVVISGATLNCGVGGSGSFDGTATYLPLDSGIILSTGLATTAIGPNNSGSAGTDLFRPGDPALTAFSGGPTYDACILEFDVEVSADTLKFNYIFGSEEYQEFVGSSYNDVFAFWIDGPGIPVPQNMAIVPGTAVPVAINNVNHITFSAYYQFNGDGFTPPYSADAGYVQYDGMTVVMEARANVIPCETYHLKLAIADGFDGIYDSGVFIEAGSLSSEGISLSSRTTVAEGFENAIEGCVDGIITFTPNPIPVDTFVLHFEIGGTATNGVDYVEIADSIVLLPGMEFYDLYIIPYVDAIPEGLETVVIYLLNECTGLPKDSAVMYIQDGIYLEALADPDAPVCPEAPVLISAEGAVVYTWPPRGDWPGFVGSDTLIFPTVSAWYVVETELGSCSEIDSVFVEVVIPPVADAGGDIDLCIGSEATLNGSGGLTYQWEPTTSLDNPLLPNPTTNTVVDITYTLVVTDASGCSDTAEAVVTIRPLPVASVTPVEAFICPGEELPLLAEGGVAYSWSPPDGLDNASIANPVLTGTITSFYTVEVLDIYGCASEAYISVRVDVFPSVEAGEQVIIDLGQSVQLDGSATNNYIWSPESTLDNPGILNPFATPDISTWYVLSATSDAGCVTRDSVLIIVIEPPTVIIPNAFTPNGDGLHDLLRPVVTRDYEGTEVDFRVFNRWGETVFQSNDLHQGWDGTFQGVHQEIGSYVYIFVGTDRQGETFTLTGNVTLLR